MTNMNDTKPLSTRPPFVLQRAFIETPFEKRYLAYMQHARQERSWHIISAVPGSGKSIGINELLRTSGAYKDRTGATFMPVLAICAPKNNARDSVLGGELALALGFSPSKWSWGRLRNELVPALDYCQIECIVIDDAHDLNMSTLKYIKELTDKLAAMPYERLVGLCLVTAHSNNAIPLKSIILQQDEIWYQFYRRMDRKHPFCVVDGHTQDEVLAILPDFEKLYQSQLPNLRLRRWASYIYEQLTNSVLDLDSSGRVTMDNLTKFVTIAIEHAYNLGESDVTPQILAETAELMIRRRDDLFHIDSDFPLFHIDGDPTDEELTTEQEAD
jgi:AAA domain-containing protein